MSHKRFEDLLRLTLSDNDNEALLALRMVQKMAGGDLTSYIAAYPKLKHDDRFETLKADLESKNKIIVELKEEIQRLRKIMSLNDTTDLRQEASPAKVLSDWIKKSIVFPSEKAWPWTATNELFESFSRYYEANNCERKKKLTIKWFSVNFSIQTQLHPRKGGPRSDRMGFEVAVKQH